MFYCNVPTKWILSTLTWMRFKIKVKALIIIVSTITFVLFLLSFGIKGLRAPAHRIIGPWRKWYFKADIIQPLYRYSSHIKNDWKINPRHPTWLFCCFLYLDSDILSMYWDDSHSPLLHITHSSDSLLDGFYLLRLPLIWLRKFSLAILSHPLCAVSRVWFYGR